MRWCIAEITCLDFCEGVGFGWIWLVFKVFCGFDVWTWIQWEYSGTLVRVDVNDFSDTVWVWGSA